MVVRIPFLEAINERVLFKSQYNALTPGIKAVLKMIYGLPLTADDKAYYDAYHGCGRFDELGYLLDSWDCGIPYTPGQEMSDITMIVGRRSTKTSGVSSFVVAYEALCGGHQEYVAFKNQAVVLLQVAQDLQTAKANLRQFIKDLLEQSEIGRNELRNSKIVEEGKRGQHVTAVQLKLNNGSLITVGPPTIKLRSQAVAVCACDELAFWSKDKDAANPDTEVIRAVSPAMASFPFSKLVKTSTPMTEDGALFEAFQTGTYGHKLHDPAARAANRRTLVLKGPSAPLAPARVLPKSRLEVERAKDPDGFRREYLAEFAKSVSGFLSPTLIRAAMDGAPSSRPRPDNTTHIYVAAMDPAFRRDAFAFSIGHMEGGDFVHDFLGGWRGTHDRPISPTTALSAIANVCRSYGIRLVTTDQYHAESLQELARDCGLVLDPCHLVNKLKLQIWGDVQGMLNQGKLKLLASPILLDEMSKMEKLLTPMGTVKIEGKHDDYATVVALNIYRALQFGERVASKPPPPKAMMTEVRERILKRQFQSSTPAWWNQ